MKKVIEISKYSSTYDLERMLKAMLHSLEGSEDYILILEIVKSNSVSEILEEYPESEEDEW